MMREANRRALKVMAAHAFQMAAQVFQMVGVSQRWVSATGGPLSLLPIG